MRETRAESYHQAFSRLNVNSSNAILDRRGLEAAVCECYKVVKDEYARQLD